MHPILGFVLLALWSCRGYAIAMGDELLLIDDRSGSAHSPASVAPWRLITDTVMGGVSSGKLTVDSVADRTCLRLRGDVRLDNNGGFLQAALDLGRAKALDASGYQGILLTVHGNGERYNLHLRTSDIRLPWQSYRSSFKAEAGWHTVRLPFGEFTAYRIGSPLDLRRIERIAVVAIGRTFAADLCVARVALYR